MAWNRDDDFFQLTKSKDETYGEASTLLSWKCKQSESTVGELFIRSIKMKKMEICDMIIIKFLLVLLLLSHSLLFNSLMTE